jgi:antitoxin MazE
MLVSKRGNTLAVRIPADDVRELGLKEADPIDLRRVEDGALEIISERERRLRARAAIDRLSRPFPPDYRFDREEAHRR